METKYEYGLLTWGGFFNAHFREVHGKEKGYYYFESKDARNDFKRELLNISDTMNARYVVFHEFEGFHVRKPVVIHRITRNKLDMTVVHTTREMFPDTDLESANYCIENSWYVGFNDYPFGDDFDYNDESSYEVLTEWVEGCFKV